MGLSNVAVATSSSDLGGSTTSNEMVVAPEVIKISAASAVLLPKEQSIVMIASYTATGDSGRLAKALQEMLDSKSITVNEAKDVMIQMYAYTGFPRSLTALNTLLSVLNERRSQGKVDDLGRGPSPLPAGTDIRALGTAIQTKLVGHPVNAPVYDFAPEIDSYLKEHLFGDIFSSDVLTYQERELATVAALASLPAPVQLRSHLKASLNVGLSLKQLSQVGALLNQQGPTAAGELFTQTLTNFQSASPSK